MNKLISITVGLIVATAPYLSHAANEKPVLVTVSGLISNTNSADKKAYTFTFEDLQKLGVTDIQATTSYNGKAIYTGPLLRNLLKTVGVKPNAKSVILVGIDDYSVRAPISDFEKWDVVLAYSLNGKRMELETKGPLWVMYPIDKNPELNNSAISTKFVWNLVKIIVK